MLSKTRWLSTNLFTLSPPSLTFPSQRLLHHHQILNPRKSLHSLNLQMSWACKKCTFLNPATPSPKPTCQICLAPSSSSPPPSPSASLASSSVAKWSCKACSFLNPYKNSNCEVCDTRAPISSLSSFEDFNDSGFDGGDIDSSVGSVFLPLQRCNKRQRVEDDPVEVDQGSSKLIKTVSGSSGFDAVRKVDVPIRMVMNLSGCSNSNVAQVQEAEKAQTLSGSSGFNVVRKVEVPEKDMSLSRCSNSNVVRGVKEAEKGMTLSDSSGFNAVRKVEAPEKDMSLWRCSNSKEVKDSNKSITVSDGTSSGSSGVGLNTLKILSYNVWFREDLELHKRMKAIGDLIQLHCPDLICFQEVTPDIYDIFRQSGWWKMYQCSVSNQMAKSSAYFCMQLTKLRLKSFSCKPFGYSAMGRQLCVAEVEAQEDKHLVVATSHLESPCPGPPKWDQMYSKERVAQAKEAVDFLKNKNVIFCGDMNWDDKLDGRFPLADKWIDAWEQLRPGEDGFTYDTKSNKMLTGNRSLRKRLDRVLCSLHDFRVSTIEMIGMDAIPGASYIKEKKVKGEIKELVLPVLPSDHFGLLLTISSL